jgi:hypothetical protein
MKEGRLSTAFVRGRGLWVGVFELGSFLYRALMWAIRLDWSLLRWRNPFRDRRAVKHFRRLPEQTVGCG